MCVWMSMLPACLTAITPDSTAQDAVRLSGPVIPGMPNLHSHAFQRVMAGLAEVAGNPQDSFWTWRDLMYRTVQRLTPDQVGIIARQLYIEMLKGGYTQVAEFHYLHNDISGNPYADRGEMTAQLSAAADLAGIGLTLLPVLYSYAGFGGQPAQAGQVRFIQDADTYLRQQAIIRQQITGKVLQNQGLCFHSLRAVTPTQMQQVLQASDPALPVHIHIAEQQKEVNDCLSWSGQRPDCVAVRSPDIDARWCLSTRHMRMRRSGPHGAKRCGCRAVPHNRSESGRRYFPGVDYLAQRGHWGIGSDSHVSLNVVEELRWFDMGSAYVISAATA
ncbi:formimidoylglutamate deiminase [Klebsiella pneumoniae]